MLENSQIVKRATRKKMHVQFAQMRDGVAVYRDAILADSVADAIANRFQHCGGTLPAGFIVEKVTDCK